MGFSKSFTSAPSHRIAEKFVRDRRRRRAIRRRGRLEQQAFLTPIKPGVSTGKKKSGEKD
jgi:hypothetical protein